MARLSHNSEEIYLQCGDCDIVFRHEESDQCTCKTQDCDKWDSPCCHRRYSLIISDDSNEICGITTHGYRDRKSRDKYQVLNDKGIYWAWVNG